MVISDAHRGPLGRKILGKARLTLVANDADEPIATTTPDTAAIAALHQPGSSR